jgi:DNA invertase Pin-like site-specific DNA recombinase
MVFGYCRVSTPSQNIERQKRNILAKFPYATLYCEAHTGTELQGRKELDKLLKRVKNGDTIVYDSASRMSRNVEEATELYAALFKEGVELIFLKEPHINTSVYKKALNAQIEVDLSGMDPATKQLMSDIIRALNNYTVDLAQSQIQLVFEQAEKEVKDIQQRTKEGMLTAKLEGKRIGNQVGDKLTTKKSIQAKKIILKHSKDFGGTLNDKEVQQLAGISRNTYYTYKKQLKEEEVNK